VYNIQAQHSDTDILFHVNQSVYLRYCFDAAQNAISAGFLTGFSGDLFAKRVALVDMLHAGEGFAGDHLVISLWENIDEKHSGEADSDFACSQLLFVIKTDAAKVLFSATVRFYDDECVKSKL